MKKDDTVFINDIITAFTKIIDYVKGLSENDFFVDEKTQDAVIRKFEVAGEAVKNISEEFKQKYPAIPWKKMAGMRDKIIHDYAGVDKVVIWETIKILSDLLKDLNKI